jgi:hypothetical protein
VETLSNLRNPEDGDNTFSETSVKATATQYQLHEDVLNSHGRESSPEDCGPPILTLSMNFRDWVYIEEDL